MNSGLEEPIAKRRKVDELDILDQQGLLDDLGPAGAGSGGLVSPGLFGGTPSLGPSTSPGNNSLFEDNWLLGPKGKGGSGDLAFDFELESPSTLPQNPLTPLTPLTIPHRPLTSHAQPHTPHTPHTLRTPHTSHTPHTSSWPSQHLPSSSPQETPEQKEHRELQSQAHLLQQLSQLTSNSHQLQAPHSNPPQHAQQHNQHHTQHSTRPPSHLAQAQPHTPQLSDADLLSPEQRQAIRQEAAKGQVSEADIIRQFILQQRRELQTQNQVQQQHHQQLPLHHTPQPTHLMHSQHSQHSHQLVPKRFPPHSYDDQLQMPQGDRIDLTSELLGTFEAQVLAMGLFPAARGVGREHFVHLVPTPLPGDRNAVKVFDAMKAPIGYLDPATAGAISGLVGQGLIQVDKIETKVSRVEETSSGEMLAELRVDIQGNLQAGHRQAIVQFLQMTRSEARFLLPRKASDLNHWQGGMAIAGMLPGKSVREIENDLDKIFNSSVDLSLIPQRSPHWSVTANLYPYQKQGLGWMYSREEKRSMLDGKTSSFMDWEKQQTNNGVVYYNRSTKVTRRKPPMHPRGGILADEMGLGKTLQIISLIASTCLRACMAKDDKNGSGSDTSDSEAPDSDDSEDDEFDSDRRFTPKMPRSRPTLIVCPLSVLTNWEYQIKSHVEAGHLDVYTYHGPARDRNMEHLSLHDVVITTYNILASEYVEPKKEEKKKEKDEAKQGGQKLRPDGTPYETYGNGDSSSSSSSSSSSNNKSNGDGSNDGGNSDRNSHRKDKSDRGSSALFRIRWLRIILDEAHVIANRRTRQSKAACAVSAQRRWCVTGTPFQNRLTDAFALLQFLRVEPFSVYQWWNQWIIKPYKNRNPKGLERLRGILGSTCLRRHKTQKINGKQILHLPPKRIFTHTVKLDGQEKELYDKLDADGKSQFHHLLKSGVVMKHYAFVLEMLLRMRQACDHANLVPPRYHQEGFLSHEQDKDLRKRLLTLLKESLTDECAACNKRPDDPTITVCAHFFCRVCIMQCLKLDPKCPSCDVPLRPSQVVGYDEQLDEEDEEQKALMKEREKAAKKERAKSNKLRLKMATGSPPPLSAKLKALMEHLQRFRKQDPAFKAVIFSQWTSFLNIVKRVLVSRKLVTVRLDGAMSNHARQKAIASFRDDPKVQIFLISLKAGGVGLNLTAANKVFLMDPWWNPATEDQAIDRIHRLGQKKEVEVIKIIAEGTVEEKILELQKSKREMITNALGARKSGDSLGDLKTLFN